jgi:hypothetical protein
LRGEAPVSSTSHRRLLHREPGLFVVAQLSRSATAAAFVSLDWAQTATRKAIDMADLRYDGMRAIFVNCTLKRSPERSQPRA